jgi:hypothetical protein
MTWWETPNPSYKTWDQIPNVQTILKEILVVVTRREEYTPTSMPSPLAALVCAISAVNLQAKSQVRPPWPDPLVKARDAEMNLALGGLTTLSYTNGATVTYGVTTLTADTVTVDLAAMRGVAKGHVHVTDPDVTIDAEELDFTWKNKQQFGHIGAFSGLFEGLSIRAASADLSPGKVILTDIEARPASSPGLYRLESKRLTFIAGKYIQIKNPHLRVLGVDIPWHKTMTFNQDPRVSGVSLPAFSYSNGSYGVNYSPSQLIEPQTSFQMWADIFKGSDPHYGVELAHTYLNPSIPNQGKIVPTSDLDARFGYGYFDNVKIVSPRVEFQTERLLRDSIAFDTDVNQGSTDRLPGGNITKLGEVVYENGGPLGSLAQASDLRLQTAKEEYQSSFTTRFIANTSIGLPPMRLLPDLDSVIRFDAQGFASDRLFGWARAQFGLAVNPVKPITLSAAYVTAAEEGTPDLTTDELYNNGAWCFRGDAYFGSIRASYLLRYYLNGIFFDNEYEISQVVGALRVSVLYRTFPSDFRFGVTFRLDEIIATLKKHHEPPASIPQPGS